MSDVVRALTVRIATGGGRRMMPLQPRGRGGWVVFGRVISRFVVPVVVVVAWWLVTRHRAIDPIFLPSPADLWRSFWSMRGPLGPALETTVAMTLGGFLIGTFLGIVMGLLMAYSRIIRDLFGTVLDFIRPVPIFALIPLLVLWLGIGRGPQITLIALGTSVLLGVTTIEAIRNVPPVYVKAGLVLGASRTRIYRTVIVPSITPHLVGAIRVAAAASWGLDVAAEFMGSQQGLGYLMISRQSYLDTAGILVIVVIYSLLALALDQLIRHGEARVTRWSERQSHTGLVSSVLGTA